MTERQFEIADKLIGLTMRHNCMYDKDQMTASFLDRDGVPIEETNKWNELKFVISILVEKKLVEWLEGNHRIRLKDGGLKAAEIGVAKFLKQEEDKNRHLTIQGGNVNFGGTVSEQSISQSSFNFDNDPASRPITNEIAPHATTSIKSKFFAIIVKMASWILQHAIMPTVCSVLSVIIWEIIIRPLLVARGLIH